MGDHDWGEDRLFDSAIVRHSFAPYMRDYDVIIEVPAAKPGGGGSYIEGRYRYRFTHCVEARVETDVPPETWKRSWADEFTDYAAWEAAGNPSGFVWGVKYANAYPGARTVADSHAAAKWSEKLGQAMYEVEIRATPFLITLVCHDLRVDRLATGDSVTGALSPNRVGTEPLLLSSGAIAHAARPSSVRLRFSSAGPLRQLNQSTTVLATYTAPPTAATHQAMRTQRGSRSSSATRPAGVTA